jgi:hypothetical protein
MTQTPQPPNSRLDQIEAILLQIAQQQQINTADIAENTAAIDALIETVSVMVSEGDAERAQAAADRQQAAIDRQAWQAEIQRIWQYLESQTGNGNGRSVEE